MKHYLMKAFILVFVLFLWTPVLSQQERVLEPDPAAGVTKVTYFHSNGAISQTGYYDAKGRLHSDWVSYDEDGNQLAAGTYQHGQRTGKWMFWGADKLTEVNFSGNTILDKTEWHTGCTLAQSDN